MVSTFIQFNNTVKISKPQLKLMLEYFGKICGDKFKSKTDIYKYFFEINKTFKIRKCF